MLLNPAELLWDLTAMQQGGEASIEMSFPVFLTESGTLVYNITASPMGKVFPLSSRGADMEKAEIHLLL